MVEHHMRYTNVVYDAGGVLFSWRDGAAAENSKTAKNSKELKRNGGDLELKSVLRSGLWHEYESGRLHYESIDQVYELVGRHFNLQPERLSMAFQSARESLRPNEALLQTVKEQSAQGMRLFCMSNIGAYDYEYMVRRFPHVWTLFERVFPSATAGMCKPEMGFFDFVMKEANLKPEETIFVDDCIENVVVARAMGIRSILFTTTDEVIHKLNTLCVKDWAIQKGREYLNEVLVPEGGQRSITSDGIQIKEAFAHILISDLTGHRYGSLQEHIQDNVTFNYFHPSDPFSHNFPADMDTTSLALSVQYQQSEISLQTLNRAIDHMLAGFFTRDGLPYVYFDLNRPRIDAVVTTNVLALFHLAGRGEEVASAESFVYKVLLHRAYEDGTTYYLTAEAFLFFLGRLIHLCKECSSALCTRFKELFVARVRERSGVQFDALSTAMRLYIYAMFRIRDLIPADRQHLLSLQRQDGSWPPSPYTRFHTRMRSVGNVALTTALAVKALEMANDQLQHSNTTSITVA